MTEHEHANPLPENGDAEAPPADPASLLRRAVMWLAVVAFLYAAACAMGVVFGITWYRVVSADGPSVVRYALAFIVEKVMLFGACVLLGRALWRYARALERPDGEAVPVDATILTARQLSCWQALTWAALLYAGWVITIAFMGG